MLRETGGRGTTFIAGDDPVVWGNALRTLVEDDGVHAAAREAGLSHAARYGWERTAAGIRDWLLTAAGARE